MEIPGELGAAPTLIHFPFTFTLFSVVRRGKIWCTVEIAGAQVLLGVHHQLSLHFLMQ